MHLLAVSVSIKSFYHWFCIRIYGLTPIFNTGVPISIKFYVPSSFGSFCVYHLLIVCFGFNSTFKCFGFGPHSEEIFIVPIQLSDAVKF